jgi:ABC-type uncharacterized transport system substrate-binding protein
VPGTEDAYADSSGSERRVADWNPHRNLEGEIRIIGLASRHKLPAVYPFRYYAQDGGLITYGPDTLDPVRRAAEYVNRILRGEKPADLPVQAPTNISS